MFRFDSRVRWCLVAGLVACLVVVGGVDQVQAFKQFSSKNKSFIKLWKNSQLTEQFGRRTVVPKVFSRFFGTKGNKGFAGSWLKAQNLKPGQIITLAGNSEGLYGGGFGGDGGLAINAKLNMPSGVFVTQDGYTYIADSYNHRVRRISPEGVIHTIAGTGEGGFGGDGGLAVNAKLNLPVGVFVASDGYTYITEYLSGCVRRVSPEGIIQTVVGAGGLGGMGIASSDKLRSSLGKSSGDGSLAINAKLYKLVGVFVTPDGHTYITDQWGHRMWRVSSEGVIQAVTGIRADIHWHMLPGGFRNIVAVIPKEGGDGDGGLAINSKLYMPSGVFVTPDGHIYIADMENHRVRRVSPQGVINTVVGTGKEDFGGDGGPVVSAHLNKPFGVFVTPDGYIYIADSGNHRVRRVTPEGVINTIVGTGKEDFGGDGGPAVSAHLNKPLGVFVTHDGYAYITDSHNNRVRVVKLEEEKK